MKLAVTTVLLVFATNYAYADMSVVAAQDAKADAGSSKSSSIDRQENSATLIGKNGLARLNSDTIQTRNGLLTVNGIPYGQVGEKSLVRYTAKGNEKVLTVDGVVRTPRPVR